MNLIEIIIRNLFNHLHCAVGLIIFINFCAYILYKYRQLNHKIDTQIIHVNRRINGLKFKYSRSVNKKKSVQRVQVYRNSNYEDLQNTFIAQDDILTQ